MNDLYEHKAKKYKYKYLELKNRIEYNGVGGLQGMKIPIPREWKFWNNRYYEQKLEAKAKAVNEQNKKKEEEEERDKQIYINSLKRLSEEIQNIYKDERALIEFKYNRYTEAVKKGEDPGFKDFIDKLTEKLFLTDKKYCNEINGINGIIYKDGIIYKNETNNKEYKEYKCYTQEELNNNIIKENERRQQENKRILQEYEESQILTKMTEAKKHEAEQAAIDEAKRIEDKRKENPFYIPILSSPYNFRHGNKHDEYIEWKKNVYFPVENKNRVERHKKISKLFEEKDIYVLNNMFIEYKKIMIELNRGQYNLENRKQLTYREIINLLDNEFDTKLPQKEQQEVNAEMIRVEYLKNLHSGTNGPG